MKRLALVLLVLASVGCQPEQCGCIRTTFVLDTNVEPNIYRVSKIENVDCQDNDAVKLSEDSYYMVICN